MNDTAVINLEMTEPAVYKIRIQGKLNEKWADRIEGMNVTSGDGVPGSEDSILVGRIRDQAALSGILNTLYELHMPVLSVECLDKG